MKKIIKYKLVVFLTSLSALLSCTSGFQGEYSDPDKQELVDDRWNETDARKTAESMIKGMLKKSWLRDYRTSKKKKPIVVVSEIENRTDEHIDYKALTEFMQDELINSGKVRFVAKRLRNKLLKELSYQNSGGVSKKTRKSAKGKQIGADFMLSGAISSQVHTQGGLKTVSYQTALTLTDIESFEVVWSNKFIIKKRFKRSSSKW